MEHFNKLSPAEAERLAILIEECSEVIQAAVKILRHGYESGMPDYIYSCLTNRETLERELGDFVWILRDMTKVGDVSPTTIDTRASSLNWKNRFEHHQGQRKQ